MVTQEEDDDTNNIFFGRGLVNTDNNMLHMLILWPQTCMLSKSLSYHRARHIKEALYTRDIVELITD